MQLWIYKLHSCELEFFFSFLMSILHFTKGYCFAYDENTILNHLQIKDPDTHPNTNLD